MKPHQIRTIEDAIGDAKTVISSLEILVPDGSDPDTSCEGREADEEAGAGEEKERSDAQVRATVAPGKAREALGLGIEELEERAADFDGTALYSSRAGDDRRAEEDRQTAAWLREMAGILKTMLPEAGQRSGQG